MNQNSRTAKSIKNSLIAIGFYCVNLILQFFSRKIFLEYLGAEILGLNTTAMNLLQFLNLAELGIGSAVGFSLYKPLHDNDNKTICEIITLQGKLYKQIALIIILGAAILMCFFPLIFAKIKLPLWYAYASFGVLLFSSLLGYFINYKQILLTTNQQDYKILYGYKSVMIIKVLFQMACVYCFTNGYAWWLIWEAVFAIIGSISLSKLINRSFPELQILDVSFCELKDKYNELTLKIKQLFFHKIAGFALTKSSPLIIYAFTNLYIVALYGNYLIIVGGIQLLVASLFNSITASIGNLIAEGNKEKSIKIFYELFSIRFYIVVIVCFCTYVLTPDFIDLWIGDKFLLPNSSLLIIVLIMYFDTIRNVVDSYIQAYGLYHDIWAPIIEAIINSGLSIWLGCYWGLNGVLLGVLISLIIIVSIWKPYFLFTHKFHGELTKYILMYIKHLGLSVIVISIMLISIWRFGTTPNGWMGLGIKSLSIGITFSILLYAILYISHTGITDFTHRIRSILKRSY